jgi:hypothetical protein
MAHKNHYLFFIPSYKYLLNMSFLIKRMTIKMSVIFFSPKKNKIEVYSYSSKSMSNKWIINNYQIKTIYNLNNFFYQIKDMLFLN